MAIIYKLFFEFGHPIGEGSHVKAFENVGQLNYNVVRYSPRMIPVTCPIARLSTQIIYAKSPIFRFIINFGINFGTSGFDRLVQVELLFASGHYVLTKLTGLVSRIYVHYYRQEKKVWQETCGNRHIYLPTQNTPLDSSSHFRSILIAWPVTSAFHLGRRWRIISRNLIFGDTFSKSVNSTS